MFLWCCTRQRSRATNCDIRPGRRTWFAKVIYTRCVHDVDITSRPPKISAAIGQRNIIICAPLRVTLFAWNIKSLFFGFRRGVGVNICGNLWLLLSVVCDKFHWVIMGGLNNNFEIDCTIVQYIKIFVASRWMKTTSRWTCDPRWKESSSVEPSLWNFQSLRPILGFGCWVPSLTSAC